jgi:hypothetical protein
MKSNAKSDDPLSDLRVITMNNDFNSFPKGSYRIYNLSDYEIGGIFSEQQFTITGKNSKTIEIKGADQVDVRIHFSSKINDEWVSQINTRWRHDLQSRNIVFVTDDQSSRRPKIRIKTITQYLTE